MPPTVKPKLNNLLLPSDTSSGIPVALSLIPCSMILEPVLNISNGNAMKLPNGDKRNALPALPIYA